jgi:NADH:ubiquinone oxidoreductase subunit 6 (subunit J)
MQNTKLSVPKKHYGWPVVYSVTLLGFAYAIIRYNVAGPVPWKDTVFFITNKAISMSTLILITITFSIMPLKNLGIKISDEWLQSRKILGFVGFAMLYIHVFMSLMLFKPSVYSKFFQSDNTLTFFAGISMLGGVLGFVILWVYNTNFNPNFRKESEIHSLITSKNMVMFSIIFTCIHLIFMGIEGWFKPQDWHGGMPPISLVSFVILASGLIVNLLGRK